MATAAGEPAWYTKFKRIPESYRGDINDIPVNDYIINFHKIDDENPLRLPREFTAQSDYDENNLNILIAAGDMMPTDVRNNPNYHIYICLPGVSSDARTMKANLDSLLELNARGDMKRVIFYLNILDEGHLGYLLSFLMEKVNIIDSLAGCFTFNEVAAELLLKPGGKIIIDIVKDDMPPPRCLVKYTNFICEEKEHPLGRRFLSEEGEKWFVCIKRGETSGGKRRRRNNKKHTKRGKRRHRKTRKQH